MTKNMEEQDHKVGCIKPLQKRAVRSLSYCLRRGEREREGGREVERER